MSLIPLGILAASGAGGGGAFESIATATGTGSSGTITLNSIPAGYQHLQLRWKARTTESQTEGYFIGRFNNDSGTNYMGIHYLFGDGSSRYAGAGSTGQTAMVLERPSGADATSGVMGVGIMDLLDYANTSKYKTVRTFCGIDNNGNGTVWLYSNLYNSTSAISRIDLITASGSWTSDTQFALYGIKGS